MDKSNFQKKLGENIKKHRIMKNLTQSQLAKACEKDSQSIERVENGKINASTFYVFEIAQALKIKLKDLLDF